MPRRSSPEVRLFISHAEHDREIVEVVVQLIIDTLKVEERLIRCTAVRGHDLGLGQEIATTLAEEIRATSVVLGVITNASLQSQWVLFELGAAWVLGKRPIPLIHPKLSVDVLPGPLSTVHAANLGDVKGIGQTLQQISDALDVDFRSPLTLHEKISEAVRTLDSLAMSPSSPGSESGSSPQSSGDLRESELAQLRLGGYLRGSLHPMIERLFGSEIDEFISNIADAVEDQTIRVGDIEKFRYHYGRMLKVFPDAHFLATSLPYQRYFWKRPDSGGRGPFELRMERFIQGGGRFSRIFFLYESDEEDEEVQETLRAQAAIGVNVYTADAEALPRRLLRFFVVDEDRKIGWKTDIDARQRLMNIQFTVSQEKLKSYGRLFEQILGHEKTRRFSD